MKRQTLHYWIHTLLAATFHFLFLLKPSEVAAAEEVYAKVMLIADGDGTASVGGVGPTGETVSFRLDTPISVNIKASEREDETSVIHLQIVPSSCGSGSSYRTLRQFTIKDEKFADSNVAPTVDTRVTEWEDGNDFIDVHGGGEGGDSTTTGPTAFPYVVSTIVGRTVMFQRTADVGSRSKSSNGSSGSSGSSENPGSVIGTPAMDQPAHVTPAIPRPVVDGICCGGVSTPSKERPVTFLPDGLSTLAIRRKCEYEFPLGGFIPPHQDMGMSYGKLVLKADMDISAFDAALESVIQFEGIDGRGAFMSEGDDDYYLIGAGAFAFIVSRVEYGAYHGIDIARYPYLTVFSEFGPVVTNPTAPPIRRYTIRFHQTLQSGGSPLHDQVMEISHFEGTASEPYKVDSFSGGMSSAGASYEWRLNDEGFGLEKITETQIFEFSSTPPSVITQKEHYKGSLLKQSLTLRHDVVKHPKRDPITNVVMKDPVTDEELTNTYLKLKEEIDGLSAAQQRKVFQYGVGDAYGPELFDKIVDEKVYAKDSNGTEYLEGSSHPYFMHGVDNGFTSQYSPWLNDTGDDADDWKLWEYDQGRVLLHSSLPGNALKLELRISSSEIDEDEIDLETIKSEHVFGRPGERYKINEYWTEKKARYVGIMPFKGTTPSPNVLKLLPVRAGLKASYSASGNMEEFSREEDFTPTAPEAGDYPVSHGPYKRTTHIQNAKINGISSSGAVQHSTEPKQPWKTTRTSTVTGKAGTASEVQEVWDGSDWLPFTRTIYDYDSNQRLTTIKRDGAVVESRSYNNSEITITDYQGVATRRQEGENGEVLSETRLSRPAHADGWEAQPEIVTTYNNAVTYEPLNPRLVKFTTRSTSRTAGQLSETSSTKVDRDGRTLTSTDLAGLTTSYATQFSNGYKMESSTVAGRTQSSSYYLDGQLRSVVATGQPTRTYTYQVKLTAPDGILERETIAGNSTHQVPAYSNTRLRTGDGLVKEETVNGVKTYYSYDDSNRLIKKQIGDLNPDPVYNASVYLYNYDYRDVVIKEGWDMNGDGVLTTDSTDTLTERDRYYEKDAQNRVWLVTEESVYVHDNNNSSKQTTIVREAQGMGAEGETWTSYPNGVEEWTKRIVDNDGVTLVESTTSAQPGRTQRSVYYYGRLVAATTYANSSPVRYMYDGLGRRTHVVDPRTSEALITHYDPSSGRVFLVTQPSGLPTSYQYNSTDGSLEWTETPDGRTNYNEEWSAAGRTLTVSGPATYPATYHFVGDHLAQIVTNGGIDDRLIHWNEGRVSDRSFGRYQSFVGYTYREGLLTERTWQITGGIGGNQTHTAYTYDGARRLKTIDYQDTTPDVSLTYDRSGRIKTKHDASGAHTFEYDPDGTVTETVSSELLQGLEIISTVNGAGQKADVQWSFHGAVGTISYQYLDGKMQTAKLSLASSSTPLVTAEYDYHPDSSLVHHVSRPITGGLPLVGTHTLDDDGKTEGLSWKRGTDTLDSVEYVPDSSGRRWQDKRHDGSTIEYEYNPRGELETVLRKRADGSLRPDWTHEYSYDDLGDRTQIITPEGEVILYGHVPYGSGYTDYDVRSKQWLRGRAHASALVTVNNQPVQRDGALWRTLISHALPSGVLAATVNASRPDLSPQPSAQQKNLRLVAGASSWGSPYALNEWTSNDRGDTLCDGRWNYTWDVECRMTSAEERFIGLPGESQVPVRRLEMIYDAEGRRVSKKVLTNVRNADGTLVNAQWSFKSETIFLWHDWTLLAEFVRLTPTGTPMIRRSYLWGLDIDGTLGGAGGVGGLLWVADHAPGSMTSFRQLAPCYDGNGNILSWVENEGGEKLPLHRIEYDPFGQVLVDDVVRVARTKKMRDLGVAEEWFERPPFGFSTKYEDRETGLLYYGYRYYTPEMGRWMSRDPIEEQGGINLWGMVGNDLINHWDYLGLDKRTLVFVSGPDGNGDNVIPKAGWVGTNSRIEALAATLTNFLGYRPGSYLRMTGQPVGTQAELDYYISVVKRDYDLKFEVEVKFKYAETASEAKNFLNQKADAHILLAHGTPGPPGETGVQFHVPGATDASGKKIAAAHSLKEVVPPSSPIYLNNSIGVGCCFPGKVPKQVNGVRVYKMVSNGNYNGPQFEGTFWTKFQETYRCLSGATKKSNANPLP